jgi:hypothetical protein
MIDPWHFLRSVLGGLFLGYVVAVVSFFIGELYRKVFVKPKQFAGPALVLLVVLGGGLFYLGVVMMNNWVFFTAALAAFLWGSKPLFTSV